MGDCLIIKNYSDVIPDCIKYIYAGDFSSLSNENAVKAAFDALPASDPARPVIGRFDCNGRFMFIAYKYQSNNVDYGTMQAQKYSQTNIFILSVNAGTKTLKTITGA